MKFTRRYNGYWLLALWRPRVNIDDNLDSQSPTSGSISPSFTALRACFQLTWMRSASPLISSDRGRGCLATTRKFPLYKEGESFIKRHPRWPAPLQIFHEDDTKEYVRIIDEVSITLFWYINIPCGNRPSAFGERINNESSALTSLNSSEWTDLWNGQIKIVRIESGLIPSPASRI